MAEDFDGLFDAVDQDRDGLVSPRDLLLAVRDAPLCALLHLGAETRARIEAAVVDGDLDRGLCRDEFMACTLRSAVSRSVSSVSASASVPTSGVVLTEQQQQELSTRLQQMEQATHDVAMLTDALKSLQAKCGAEQRGRIAAQGGRQAAEQRCARLETELKETKELLALADREHAEMEEELAAHEALYAAERDATAAKLRTVAGDSMASHDAMCRVQQAFPALFAAADIADVPSFCNRVTKLLHVQRQQQ